MSKFYLKWELNPQSLPATPEERAKLMLSLCEMVKNEATVKDWGNIPGEHKGYSIMEVASEVDIAISLLKWMPYVNFEVRPVITIDQSIEAIKKAVAQAKK